MQKTRGSHEWRGLQLLGCRQLRARLSVMTSSMIRTVLHAV